MPAAPPRFTPSPSSLGDRDGGGGFAPSRSNRHSQRPTNHKRPTSTRNSTFQHSRGPARPRAPSSHASGGVAGVGAVRGGGDDDPVVSSRRALGSAKMPASDLDNVNRLFALLGALVGVLLAVALVQGGVNNATLAALFKLPGDLYINAMLCVIVPTVFLNSILASMHFWTLNKAKALFYKMLAYFVVTTLWASVLGMLVGVCAAPLFSAHSLTRTTSAIARGKAAVSLQCPRSTNASIVLNDGAMSCQTPATSGNGTVFLLQDLSDSFRFRGDPRDVVTLADAMMKLLDSFFPANAIQAFLQGDLLSVIIIGAALGIALIHKSAVRTRELTPGFRTPAFDGGAGSDGSAFSGYLFLLIMQSELVLSVILRFLLKALPIAVVFMVAGGILEAHAIAPPESSELSSSTQDLVTLFGVVFFALLLHFATIMAAAMLITKSNPFRFTKHLLPAQLVALSSSSSLVALPSTVRSIAVSKQVSMPLAHFVCSTGIVLNKNGSALYLSVASVYILVTGGFHDAAMDTSSLVLLSFVGMLCSFPTPPMPRGNVVFVTTILWSIFDIQNTTNLSRMVLFLATMDWLLDPFVTAMNVTNNCLIALILSVQMDETYIEFGKFDAVSDTQEEDSNDGFPLDESDRHPMRQRAESRGAPTTYSSPARDRADTHGSGTMRPPMIARMTSVGESVVSV